MARLLFQCIVAATMVACFVSNPLWAQEDKTAILATDGDSPRAVQGPSEQSQRYLVTLSEYQLDDIDTSHVTIDGIAEAIQAEGVAPVEVIMLSTIASTESMVQFGRSISVTTSHMVSNRNVTARRTEERQVGTILRVTAEPNGGKVIARINFESSRPAGEGSEDSPPDTVTTSFETTQVFDLAQPTLIAASTSGEPSYFFLTIHQR